MEPRIVSGGASRIRSNPRFQPCLSELRKSIDARYAAALTKAVFFRRIILRSHMAAEFRCERHKIEPSLDSLPVNQVSERGGW